MRHDHNHRRGADEADQHIHEHGGGLLAAIRQLVAAHGHDHAELIDSATATREGLRRRLFHTIPRLADALLHASPTHDAGDPHATTRHHFATG
jgi:hypothetical protein